MQHPLGMLDRDQRTTKSIPAMDRNSSHCPSCQMNISECESSPTKDMQSSEDCTTVLNEKYLDRLKSSADRVYDMKRDLNKSQLHPSAGRHNYICNGRKLGNYRPVKKFNYCLLVLVYICVVLLQKSFAYPVTMDRADNGHHNPDSNCHTVNISESLNVIHDESARYYDYLEGYLECYTKKAHKKELDDVKELWSSQPVHFSYPHDVSHLIKFEYWKEIPAKFFAHINKPGPPTASELSAELRRIRKLLKTIMIVVKNTLAEREEEKAKILIEYGNNKARFEDVNKIFRDQFLSHVRELHDQVEDGLRKLPNFKTDEESDWDLLIDKNRNRNIREWLVLRESIAVFQYIKESLKILTAMCSRN